MAKLPVAVYVHVSKVCLQFEIDSRDAVLSKLYANAVRQRAIVCRKTIRIVPYVPVREMFITSRLSTVRN